MEQNVKWSLFRLFENGKEIQKQWLRFVIKCVKAKQGPGDSETEAALHNHLASFRRSYSEWNAECRGMLVAMGPPWVDQFSEKDGDIDRRLDAAASGVIDHEDLLSLLDSKIKAVALASIHASFVAEPAQGQKAFLQELRKHTWVAVIGLLASIIYIVLHVFGIVP